MSLSHVLYHVVQSLQFAAIEVHCSLRYTAMDHKRAVLRSWLNRTKPSLYVCSSLPQPPLSCKPVEPYQPPAAPLPPNVVPNRRRAQLYSRIQSEPRTARATTNRDREASVVKLPPKVAMKYPSSRPKPLQVSYTPVLRSDPVETLPSVEEQAHCSVALQPKKRSAVNHTIERGRWLTLHDSSHNAKRFLAKADSELFEGPVEAPYVDSTIDDDAATPPIVLEHYASLTLQVLRAARDKALSATRATTQWTHSAK